MTPRLDYGRYMNNGRCLEERFVLGSFDDCRIGLENYADSIATYYSISLNTSALNGYCTWYSDKNGGACNENAVKELTKAIVEDFVSKQDYETAYALLASVPKQATTCFDYAQKRQGQVLEEMKNQKAAETLVELKNAIAAAGEQYDPMAAGYLKMIPAKSKQYAEASKLYDNYVKHIQDVRLDSIKHEQKMELERLAVEQIELQHQQKASMKIADQAVSKPQTSSSYSGDTSSGSSGSKIIESFKKHPFLWGLGAGVVATGIGGIALYASLPRLAKFGLALL